MGMSRKDFITLADQIKDHNRKGDHVNPFLEDHLDTLADFCARQNPNFKRQLWLDYIAGRVGPSGGKRS